MSNKCNSSESNIKIHMFYLIFILVSVIIFLFTRIGYSNENLSNQLAFGATLSGIILSIIAIIITLIGETKSDNTKDKLFRLSEDLEVIVSKVEKATDGFEGIINSNKEVKNEITYFTKLNVAKSETAVESDDKKTTMDEKHNSFLDVLKRTSNVLTDQAFKDICITLIYIVIKSDNGKKAVAYEEFINDVNIYKLNIIDSNVAWTFVLMFSQEMNKSMALYKYVYEYSRNRYFGEINKLNILKDNLIHPKEILK